MNRAAPLFTALTALCLLSGVSLQAQEQPPETPKAPDYQRYDLVRESSELTVEATLHYRAQDVEGYGSFHSVRFGAGAEYAFKTHHSVSISLPYTLAADSNEDARQRLRYSFGDLSAGYEYLFQFSHINLFVGPVVTIPFPTVETNEYAAREGVYSSSAGRITAGAGVSVTGIRDPVVWSAGLQYQVGLPKEERFYTSWQPGNIRLSAGFSDLINHQFGFSLGLIQQVNLPEIRDDSWDTGNGNAVTVSTLGKAEFFILFEKDYVRVSVEPALYPLNQPVVAGLTYGHKFDLGKKQPGTVR